MKKYLILLQLIIFGMIAAPLPAQADSNERFVFATALVLRAAPQTGHNKVGMLAYGDGVTIIKDGVKEKIGPSSDSWCKIQAGSTEGYAFGAYLLPVPTPDLNQYGIKSFTSRLAFLKSEKSTDTHGTVTNEKHFSHGVIIKERKVKMGDGGYFSEDHLLVAGLSVNQGFLLARAIASGSGLNSADMQRTAKSLKKANGSEYIYDDSCYQIISVQETEAGVNIQFPERAD